jgi:hypothetical protein
MPAIASLHDIARFSGLARRIRRKKPSSPIKAASPTVNRRPGEPTIPSDLAAARRTIILFATDCTPASRRCNETSAIAPSPPPHVSLEVTTSRLHSQTLRHVQP